MSEDNNRHYIYRAPPPARKVINDKAPGMVYPERVVTSGCGHDHHNHSSNNGRAPVVDHTPVEQVSAKPQNIIRHLPAGNFVSSPKQLEGTNLNKPSMPSHFTALTVNDQTFDQMVLQASKPVIVIFTLPSCTACISLKNTAWQSIHSNFKDRFEMYEFICSTQSKMDKEHDISGHPSMLFFNKGNEIGVYLGYSQYEYYANYIKTLRV